MLIKEKICTLSHGNSATDHTTTVWSSLYVRNTNGNESERFLASAWEPTTKENPERHLSLSLTPKMKSEFKDKRPLMFLKLRASKHNGDCQCRTQEDDRS
ncbi:hypothetical protein Y032_0062g3336 [Ancylostoma ceylanicum]|uniref:Uncharacterized protein n=1 Tax=Ancylostoma ceylanicum TaxID=53326 RepID=A0A016U297_9BILA|nr:hypothetical protein Y032_0062g3336 [Ancylostoma ceylanicum]